MIANVKYPGEAARSAAKLSLSDEDSDNDSFDDRAIVSTASKRDVQMLLFSATMAGWICKLTAKHMTAPVFLDAVVSGETRLPSTIEHIALKFLDKRCLKSVTSAVQDAVLTRSAGGKTIVFTNTKAEADSLILAKELSSLRPQALHGGMSQAQRQATIRQFRDGKIEVLVATDVASRGLDVDGVDLIVHTQLPDDLDTYVHRSGRTGRAGREGVTVVLHSSSARETDKLVVFEDSLRFNFLRVPMSTPEVLTAAAKGFVARRVQYAKEDAERKLVERDRKMITKSGDAHKEVVAIEEDSCEGTDERVLKSWANVAESEAAAAENEILRALYRAEVATGIKGRMTPDERTRAKVLVERSDRKKARRQLQIQQGMSRSQATVVYSINNSFSREDEKV